MHGWGNVAIDNNLHIHCVHGVFFRLTVFGPWFSWGYGFIYFFFFNDFAAINCQRLQQPVSVSFFSTHLLNWTHVIFISSLLYVSHDHKWVHGQIKTGIVPSVLTVVTSYQCVLDSCSERGFGTLWTRGIIWTLTFISKNKVLCHHNGLDYSLHDWKNPCFVNNGFIVFLKS